MNLRNRLLRATLVGCLAIPGTLVYTAAHVHAATLCDDGAGNEWQEVTILPAPITLAVEIGDGGTPADPHLGVCYGTNSEAQNSAGQPEVAGGYTVVDVANPASNDGAPYVVGMGWDGNSNVQAGWRVFSAPTETVTTSPLGATIAVSIPFSVCAGPCIGVSPGLAPTGVLVASLTPVSEPGLGAGYQVNGIQVLVNGATILSTGVGATGAYVDPFGAVARSLNFSAGGPCVVGVCVPQGYVETTGSPLVGFQVLGLSFTESVPKDCVYSNPSGQCP